MSHFVQAVFLVKSAFLSHFVQAVLQGPARFGQQVKDGPPAAWSDCDVLARITPECDAMREPSIKWP